MSAHLTLILHSMIGRYMDLLLLLLSDTPCLSLCVAVAVAAAAPWLGLFDML